MSRQGRGPVVIDTGIFGARLARVERPLAVAYQPLVEGRARIISFITVAELHYGAKLAKWGEKRLHQLDQEIARSEIVWPGEALIEGYAELRTWCVQNGHGLGQKEHEADRWVAATAIRLGVPLVTHDAIFADRRHQSRPGGHSSVRMLICGHTAGRGGSSRRGPEPVQGPGETIPPPMTAATVSDCPREPR